MAKKLIVLLVAVAALAAFRDDDPETVCVTFRPKPGAEAELKKVIAAHWDTARKMNLVLAAPHVTLEMKDETRAVYYVDIFTWRDRDIPDNAPGAILAIWADMNRLTAERSGRPGLEIKEVKRIDR